LNLVRFTPAARDLFNIAAHDFGRPLSDLTSGIDDPKLLEDGRKVLKDVLPVGREVKSDDGKWYIRKILPYSTQDGKIEGIVVTFADVTEFRILQQDNKVAQDFAENILDAMRDPLLVLDENLTVVRAGESYLTLFGVTADSLHQRKLFDVQNGCWNHPELRKLLKRALLEGAPLEDFEITLDINGLGERTVLVNARRVRRDSEGCQLILFTAQDVTESIQTQRGLEEREARLSALVDAAPEAIITTDEHGIVGSFSPAAQSMLGYTEPEVIGQNVKMLMPKAHSDRHDEYMTRYLETGERRIIGIGRELTARHKNGWDVPVQLTIAEWWIGEERHFTGILHDLTDDVKRRKALQEAQKMQAIGQLTGGLAHDFNNLLTVIIGNLELLEMKVGDFPHRALIAEALEASNLGAKLTAQLLAFGRKQELDPAVVSLNDLVHTIQPILVRTLGEQIEIVTHLADDLTPTLADPGQIENVILNLAINARDAMPDGGRLTIETQNITLDADYVDMRVDVDAGDYVALSVTDTGTGMTPKVLEHAFEPFFTTKDAGVGSGLGLSMVYGFAKQSGGHVAIYSEPGIGTTVTLYLRPASPKAVTAVSDRPADALPGGNETILVVEDDPRVRRLTVTRLEGLGYRVVQAEDGPSAIKVLRSGSEIDLVLTDVVMPGGMTGFEVADQARVIRPALRVLLTTGYANGRFSGKGPDRKRHPILRKPYNLKDLAKMLRELLDRDPLSI
jgi:two-component system CheB/CheR fusion protein